MPPSGITPSSQVALQVHCYLTPDLPGAAGSMLLPSAAVTLASGLLLTLVLPGRCCTGALVLVDPQTTAEGPSPDEHPCLRWRD